LKNGEEEEEEEERAIGSFVASFAPTKAVGYL